MSISKLKLASDTADTNLLHPDYYLPSEVIDSLLVCLPIKDAMRTSVLSSKWMHKWHSISKLIFDSTCLRSLTKKEGAVELNKLANVIDVVLSLHVGPIQSFELSVDLPNSHDISRWMIILWRNHIKKLKLEFLDVKHCIASSRLLNCAELTYLELRNCQLTPTSCFSKLINLEHLVLKKVGGPSSILESLICSSPLLKCLFLDEIEGLSDLDIQALNLQVVHIIHTFCVVNISAAPRLTKLVIDLEENCGTQHPEHEGVIKIACLLKLEVLMLYDCSMQWLVGDGKKIDMLSATYHCMEEFTADVDFHQKEEFMALLSLLKAFPNLKALHICVYNSIIGNESPWEFGDESLTFNHLQVMKMSDMTGLDQELHLIKNILANAPVLKTVMLSIDLENKVTDKSNIFVELLQYRRASVQAEILIKDKIEI